jgi:hypothetical protein
MKGAPAPAPLLHWPKLFEGQVGLHTNKCVSGMGTGRDCWPDGLGDGNGYGDCWGSGYGSGWGFNE